MYLFLILGVIFIFRDKFFELISILLTMLQKGLTVLFTELFKMLGKGAYKGAKYVGKKSYHGVRYSNNAIVNKIKQIDDYMMYRKWQKK